MEDKVKQLSDLLHEVAETHHVVWKVTNGDDPDWASWYGHHMLKLTKFPVIVGKMVVRSELIYKLVELDKEYKKLKPQERWEDYYAKKLLDYFTP